MRVIATALGYYDHRRVKEGEAFVLSDPKHFSSRWMRKADEEEDAPPAKRPGKTKIPPTDKKPVKVKPGKAPAASSETEDDDDPPPAAPAAKAAKAKPAKGKAQKEVI